MATGITDKNGDLACSGMGIPAFIGCLGKAVKAIIKKFSYNNETEINEGDIFILNDPYNGGITHLNDHLILMPVYNEGELMAWCANIGHWGDIGGHLPGSMDPKATELFHEGLIIPGIKVFNKGVLDKSVVDTLKANSRLPDFVEGDLWAGIASVRVGSDRINEIIKKYGKETYNKAIEKYYDYGEQITRAGLKKLKKGTFKFSEPQENGLVYSVELTITDDKMIVDLTDNPA